MRARPGAQREGARVPGNASRGARSIVLMLLAGLTACGAGLYALNRGVRERPRPASPHEERGGLTSHEAQRTVEWERPADVAPLRADAPAEGVGTQRPPAPSSESVRQPPGPEAKIDASPSAARVEALLSMLCPEEARRQAFETVEHGRERMERLRAAAEECRRKGVSVLRLSDAGGEAAGQ